MTDAPVAAPPPRKLAYLIGDPAKTNSRVSFLFNSRWRSYLLASEQGQKLAELLRAVPQDLDAIGELADVPTWIAKRSHGRVTIDDCERLRLDGNLIDFGLTGRIGKIIEQGVSFESLANFVERLARNPDPTVAEDLYRFMEVGNLPLDPDGYVLAFKKVDDGYWSFRAGSEGKVQYLPGTTPAMPREDCDPNRHQTCSRGLHACSYEYLKFWYPQRGRLVIVRIDPEHVTAIPADHKDQKLRCCQMDVVGEISEEDAAEHFKSVVDERYPAVKSAAEEDDVLELTERVDDERAADDLTDRLLDEGTRLKLLPTDEDEAVNLDPGHWSARGYKDGREAGAEDRVNGYDYLPDLTIPQEIAGEEAARAAYSKAFVEAYDATFRITTAPAPDEPPADDEDADS